MKKTIHINLAGLVFKIEEDAYTRLDQYLEAVKVKLGGGDEAKEIIDDITLRIAEIFKGAHRDSGSAITTTQVEEVIATLGTPEDYDLNDESDAPSAKSKEWQPPLRKRLFRDTDNQILAGVCSGLSNYFNIDPIVFRLLFIIGLFYGISILPYIILWIALPKAITVQQRLSMMGGEQGQDSWVKRQSGRVERTRTTNGALRVVAVVVGIVLMVLSFVTLVGTTMALSISDLVFGTFISNGAWIPELPELLLTQGQIGLAQLGLGLLIGIPLLFLFYLGMHLVFQFKRGGTPLAIAGLVLWLAGLGLVAYTSVDTVRAFSHTYTNIETRKLDLPSSNTLYLKANSATLQLDKGKRIGNSDEIAIRLFEGELITLGNPHLRITKGGEEVKITIEKKARGRQMEEATENASLIEYFYLQKDSVLLLDRFFTLQEKAKLRNQKVLIRVEIPEGKEFVVAPGLQPLLD